MRKRTTNQSRRALETHPLHAQRAEEGSVVLSDHLSTRSTVEERAEAQHLRERGRACSLSKQRRRGANTAPTEANSLGNHGQIG